MTTTAASSIIETDIPARLDRLPWSRWHWLIVTALGITWVLDGLEVTLAGAVGGVLTRPDTLGLNEAQVGASATAYLFGAVIGAVIFGYSTDRLGRKRLFMIHGHEHAAHEIVARVEKQVTSNPENLPVPQGTIKIESRTHTPLSEIWNAMVHEHRRRSLLGLALMTSQAFFYNAIFFTYALVLITFYGVPAQKVGLYLFPFALGNFLGPLVLGKLFDSVGRKQMITITYALSGVLLALSGWLFHQGLLTAKTQALAWTVIFFVASAAASSAYLTVSEIFPL